MRTISNSWKSNEEHAKINSRGFLEVTPMDDICEHVKRLRDVKPSGNGCVECLKMGDSWVHLRLCETCGHVGCCDDSKNKHATQHAHATGHPVIKSYEPGEDWGYCYPDDLFIDELPVNVGDYHP